MNIHPVADIFPRMSPAEFGALREDIRANGQREPIWTWRGQVIDGRHRAQACAELGIDPSTREYDGDEASLVGFVVSLNLHRRHLDESQRAMVAGKLMNVQREIAKKAQAERAAWIAAARAAFEPSPRRSCAVCGRYRSVTHAHHLVPLSQQSQDESPDHRHVWLCPTHHSGVHQLLDTRFGWPDWDGFAEDEKSRMTEIAALGVGHAY